MNSHSTKFHKSKGKNFTVICRVPSCKLVVVAQNYRDHLRCVHPSENASDLRPHGQGLLRFGQGRLEAETAVAINGPELVHADQLISQAMKIHFEKAKSVKERAGYFVRRTANVKQWIISEV